MTDEKEKPAENPPTEDKEKVEEKTAETPAADSTSLLKEFREERKMMDTTVEAMKKENDRTAELQGNAVLAGKGFVVPEGPELTKEQKESADRVQRIGEAAGAQWAKKKE